MIELFLAGVACAGAGAVIAILCVIAIARPARAATEARLIDRDLELGRCYARIEALETIIDEARAAALNVTPLPRKDEPKSDELDPLILEELEMIEDPNSRAEMEADIKIQIAAHPNADPIDIAKRVIYGE